MPSGGCESIAQKGIGAVLVIAALLLVWYVSIFMKDKQILSSEYMCGGGDQCCHCSGNETFIGSDDTLREILPGYMPQQ